MSNLVWDLLGASARRMWRALADGETNPVVLAALADQLRATQQRLCDALGAAKDFPQVYRRLVKMTLEELPWIEQQN